MCTRSPIGHSFPPTKHRIFPLISVATNIAVFPLYDIFVDRPGTRQFIVVLLNFLTGIDGQNSARPSRFGQGIKSPRRPNFALKMYPIKQSRRSIVRRNPTTPKHQDIDHGVAVRWIWKIHVIAPRGSVGEHGRMRMWSTYS
jgi:hypothetical protein